MLVPELPTLIDAGRNIVSLALVPVIVAVARYTQVLAAVKV